MSGRFAEAGWYPDPEGVADLRWWTGQAWTGWVSDEDEPAYPPPGEVPVIAPAPPRRWPRRVAFGLAGLAALTTAGAVVGQRLLRADQEQTLASRPTALGAPSAIPSAGIPQLSIDPANRLVRVGNVFSAVLPGTPYTAPEADNARGLVFDEKTVSADPGTPGWNAKATWPPSLVTVALVRPSRVASGDPVTTAGVVAQALAQTLWEKVRYDLGPIAPVSATFAGRPAGRADVDVTFETGSGKATARLATTVAELRRTTVLAWVDLRVGEVSPAAAKAADAARASAWIAG